METRAARQARQPGEASGGSTVAPAAEPTIEAILAHAHAVGLPLTEEEARQLRVGVGRIRAMAAEVRRVIDRDVAPGGPAVQPMGEDRRT